MFSKYIMSVFVQQRYFMEIYTFLPIQKLLLFLKEKNDEVVMLLKLLWNVIFLNSENFKWWQNLDYSENAYFDMMKC